MVRDFFSKKRAIALFPSTFIYGKKRAIAMNVWKGDRFSLAKGDCFLIGILKAIEEEES
jgi:hypothetical protein